MTTGLVPILKLQGEPPSMLQLSSGTTIHPDARGRFWVTLEQAGVLRLAGFEIDRSEQR